MIKPILKFALRLFALLTFIVATASLDAALAQGVRATTEQQVARIRKLHAEANASIAAGLKDRSAGLHHAAYTVGGEKDGMQWRAVGRMSVRTEYYFNCEPGAEEECGADPRKLVVKIVTSYRAAADLASSAEYLFDESGELVFALDSSNVEGGDGKTIERRYYFADGKLIRVVRAAQTVDRNFTDEDRTGARNALAETRRLRNVFAMMFVED